MAISPQAAALLTLALAAASSGIVLKFAPTWLRNRGLVRTNFLGRPVVTGGGVVVVLGAIPSLLLIARNAQAEGASCISLIAALVGFGFLGFIDDRWGTPAAKGIRGHLRALVRERRVTSGMVKALGGLNLSCCIARPLLGLAWPDALVMTGVVALGANAGNLLDLRPGRAGAASILSLCAAILALSLAGMWHVALAASSVLIGAAFVQRQDARGYIMLGDTGSNSLGATAALALALGFPEMPARLSLLAALLVLHLIAERWSISRIIERSPVLRALDRLTGIRG